jgi:predicted AAA+ superfamily ATPase
MKRLIDRKFKEWKKSRRRKPLIVRGVRQVGKTYSIRQFGKNEFENLVSVDLERNTTIHRLFEGNLGIKQILSDLEI